MYDRDQSRTLLGDVLASHAIDAYPRPAPRNRPSGPSRALIAHPRNDENVLLEQLHVVRDAPVIRAYKPEGDAIADIRDILNNHLAGEPALSKEQVASLSAPAGHIIAASEAGTVPRFWVETLFIAASLDI